MLPEGILHVEQLMTLSLKDVISKPHVWLRDAIRKNAPLYDAISTFQGNHLIEMKSQQNTQWFDIGKYHELTSIDRSITMLFVMHTGKEVVDEIWEIPFGEFLDIVCSDEVFQKDGWTNSAIQSSAALKLEYKSIQLKAKLNLRTFQTRHPRACHILWQRVGGPLKHIDQ